MSNKSTQNSDTNHSTNSQNDEKIGGYDVRNKNSIAQNYICSICTLLLRNPVQLYCGHRFCQSCINADKQATIKCIKCNEETSRDKIITDRGCQKDMEILEIICSYCDWNGILKNYEQHLFDNHTNSCQYCGEKFDSMDLVVQHQSNCEKMIINCQLKDYGCTEQFLRMNLQDHLLTVKHQNVMLSALFQTAPHLMNTNNDQELKSSQMDFDSSHTTTSNSISSNDKLTETINILLNSIHVLNDDTQRLSSDTLLTQNALELLSEDATKLKVAIQETNSSLEGLKPNQQILLQDVESLKHDVEDQQYISYDGTLIWRITDVQKKIADARSEKQPSIYSPPFYSSPNGYKMCARLYLNGDGSAKGSHISLFFVLMRGEHDAILEFPFTYKVTFCLYDQTDQNRHIIDSFRPDVKSTSFQRPWSHMNIASGIPKFMPLTIIQQDNNPYIRTDTMFIKVMIHFENTPKALLPYILSINPGLTASTQQIMIKHETEKRAQEQASLTNTSTTSSTTN